MSKKLEQYLLEAEGKEQTSIDSDNPFKISAFDGTAKRLGWTRKVDFSLVEKSLKGVLPTLEGKECFVFVGIGGSGNGVKALLSLFDNKKMYVLDSLDPLAVKEILDGIDKEKTLVVPISKSGGTKETQLLALTMKEYFGDSWSKNFLWLSDPQAFAKLDSFGWDQAAKTTIQVDGENDMGGRFSCPGSLIFLLPLFILLNKDFAKLKDIYDKYFELQGKVLASAVSNVDKYKELDKAFFNVTVDKKVKDKFYPWVVQLFQESIGSKKDGVYVKTLDAPREGFNSLELQVGTDNDVVSLMCNMFFYQAVVALYGTAKGLNFVNQDFVEKYKDEMRKLEGVKIEGFEEASTEQVIEQVKDKISNEAKFIEIVLYFHVDSAAISKIEDEFSRAFPNKKVLIFIGSDWNHHSFQAAYSDKYTFFVLLLRGNYVSNVEGICDDTLLKNVETLKVISKATYSTIKDKAVLLSLV